MTMNTAHSIPEEQAAAAEDDIGRIAVGVERPSHAERAKTIVAASPQAVLSTVSRTPAGYPFGSVVRHTLDEQGNPLLCLSDLAEHTKNLTTDARASLMATQSPLTDSQRDPLGLGRVTLVGTLARCSDRRASLKAYKDAFHDAYYADFEDFNMYELQVEAVRYVGGFGVMSWVPLADYLSAEPDPLRFKAKDIVGHMNDDHADALVAYCRAFGGMPEADEATMVSVDRYGFEMLADDGSGERSVRLDFAETAKDEKQIRQAMIELLEKSRLSLDTGVRQPLV